MPAEIHRSKLWRMGLAALLLATVAAGCRPDSNRTTTAPPASDPSAVGATVTAADDGVTIIVARDVSGSIDEALIRQAFRQVVAQGERDFGLEPERTVTIYIDPDSAIGLESALGLSQKYAIHLRAGRSRSMNSLLPLLMHEYTHFLQYQTGRLRPQWWIEGQADHQALRVREPAAAERERRTVYGRLADDVRSGRAPQLSELRGSTAWDNYVKKAGAGAAYGWGNAAVGFIEARAGYAGVVRIMTDRDGPNTLGRFDELVRELTGLDPTQFDAALKQWLRDSRG